MFGQQRIEPVQVDLFLAFHAGHVVGHVDVEDAVIYGIVSGSIRATRVRLARSSKVIADITHDILSIDEGASFEGQCRRVAFGDETNALLRTS